MIYFKKIRFKNILSFGNQFTQIQLDRSPSTMITGANGVGKSSFSDSLCFALFGKPFRKIKKDRLINLRNAKDLLVELEFSKGTDEYLIRRGIKPNIFEVYQNGKLLNQDASVKDYQAYLETQILDMNYDAACQIILIGKAHHTMFMNMSAGERRKFVQTVLNLVVFSNMAKIHGSKTTQIKNKIQELKGAVQVSGEKILLKQRYIEDLKSADKKTKDEQKTRITQQINQLYGTILHLREKLQDLGDSDSFDRVAYKKHLDKLNSHTQMLVKLESTLSQVEKNIEDLDSSTNCYACNQPLQIDNRDEQIRVLSDKKTGIDKARQELLEKIQDFKKIVAQFDVAFEKYEQHQNQRKQLEIQLQSNQMKRDYLTSQLNEEKPDQSEKIKQAREQLKKIKHLNKELEKKLDQTFSKLDYMSIIGTMLKDTGIKSMLIKQFIPIINAEVNNYLTKLGLFVTFHLDQNFDETIKSRGFDSLGYNSFSEGQKLRIDLALLMAWRSLAKMQGNVSTNLLVMDEVMDASLDQGGAEAFADLLNLAKDLNVFIVTHTPEKIQDKIRSSLSFEKVEGFSKIV